MKATDLTPEQLSALLLTMPPMDTTKWVHTKIHHNPKLRLLTRVIDAISDLSAALEGLHAEAEQTGSSQLPSMLAEYFKRHATTDPWIRAGFQGSRVLQAYSDEIADIHKAASVLLRKEPDLRTRIIEAKQAHTVRRNSEIPDPPQKMEDDLLDLLQSITDRRVEGEGDNS